MFLNSRGGMENSSFQYSRFHTGQMSCVKSSEKFDDQLVTDLQRFHLMSGICETSCEAMFQVMCL